MPQAIASPEDLERFALELRQFNEQLRQNTSRIRAQFSRLGDTWRDQEHVKFAQQFDQTIRTIDQFARAADEHVPFLQRKAAILRDYLNRH